jgi:hypothetical protein
MRKLIRFPASVFLAAMIFAGFASATTPSFEFFGKHSVDSVFLVLADGLDTVRKDITQLTPAPWFWSGTEPYIMKIVYFKGDQTRGELVYDWVLDEFGHKYSARLVLVRYNGDSLTREIIDSYDYYTSMDETHNVYNFPVFLNVKINGKFVYAKQTATDSSYRITKIIFTVKVFGSDSTEEAVNYQVAGSVDSATLEAVNSSSVRLKLFKAGAVILDRVVSIEPTLIKYGGRRVAVNNSRNKTGKIAVNLLGRRITADRMAAVPTITLFKSGEIASILRFNPRR